MGRTYAISDVHGMGHLLDQMLEKIAFSEADRLYVLGDLIDRGPDPAGGGAASDLLQQLQPRVPHQRAGRGGIRQRAGSGNGTEKYHCIKRKS